MTPRLPPGPRLPATVQAVAWAQRPLPFLKRCHARFGDIFTLRIRNAGTWVVLGHPDHVRQVFTANHNLLGVGIANSILGPLLGPRSVMLLEEPDHIERRRLMLGPFHGERMSSYTGVIAEETRRQVSRWPLGEPFALWPHMQEITLAVIVRVIFGDPSTPRMRRLRRQLRELTDWMNDPRRMTMLAAVGPRWLTQSRDYRSVIQPVEHTVLEEVLHRRRQRQLESTPDIASMLAHANYEDGSPMTEQDLRDELVTLLTDGPTSALLCWAFERLLRHPEKLALLKREVETAAGHDYADAVIKETLRLCPAAPIVVRRILTPTIVGEFELPAETTVAPCVHLIHRRPEIYPDPLQFRPERFVEDAPSPYSWIPFGGGVRRCPAASYAQVLMRVVLITIVQEVDLAAAHPSPETPLRSAITFVPARHGQVVVTSRLDHRAQAPI